MAHRDRRPTLVLVPRGRSGTGGGELPHGCGVAEHVPQADTEPLRLLPASLHRRQAAEPDGLS
ncbi:hypothetical protein [Streptomyces sp. NBC_01506]|uniref:hypothetical protein n=1 Tax=Streptomyces sp. NBC_01506 TaxID=2903887 RepID=UPI00386A5400